MADGNWVRVAGTGDIGEGEVRSVRIGGRDLAIYHLTGGEYYATDNICSHEYAQLSDGWLEGCEIECPLHAGKFDVRTGKALCAPVDKDLETFAVQISGSDILVMLPT